MLYRNGEEVKSRFRCERYYHTDDGWWCQTREHTELGPFSSHHDAEMELCLYIRSVNLSQNSLEQKQFF